MPFTLAGANSIRPTDGHMYGAQQLLQHEAKSDDIADLIDNYCNSAKKQVHVPAKVSYRLASFPGELPNLATLVK